MVCPSGSVDTALPIAPESGCPKGIFPVWHSEVNRHSAKVVRIEHALEVGTVAKDDLRFQERKATAQAEGQPAMCGLIGVGNVRGGVARG